MSEDHIRDVIADEQGRGRRRPHDPAARRERRRALDLARLSLSRDCDEEGFKEIIRGLGLQDGTPEFQNALKVWRANRKP